MVEPTSVPPSPDIAYANTTVVVGVEVVDVVSPSCKEGEDVVVVVVVVVEDSSVSLGMTGEDVVVLSDVVLVVSPSSEGGVGGGWGGV